MTFDFCQARLREPLPRLRVMLFHSGERLLHLGQNPKCNSNHVGVTVAFEFRDQLTLADNSQFLVENMLSADLKCIFRSFGGAIHIKRTPPGSEGSFDSNTGRQMPN
jgi:hypothetical protein